ncbi:MAG TPA: hypothetical protein VI454_09035 [Verrucomicrobiae bacterium]|jgi:hypothetical protein
MSAGKLDTSGIFNRTTTGQLPSTLLLPTNAVRIRKNGIEFLSATAIPQWTEMSVELHSPRSSRKLTCTGIVVSCAGCAQTGYSVSMLFLNLTRQSEQRLASLAYSQLS